MNPPGLNFANSAVWDTIVFQVSAFQLFSQEIEIETVCFVVF